MELTSTSDHPPEGFGPHDGHGSRPSLDLSSAGTKGPSMALSTEVDKGADVVYERLGADELAAQKWHDVKVAGTAAVAMAASGFEPADVVVVAGLPALKSALEALEAEAQAADDAARMAAEESEAASRDFDPVEVAAGDPGKFNRADDLPRPTADAVMDSSDSAATDFFSLFGLANRTDKPGKTEAARPFIQPETNPVSKDSGQTPDDDKEVSNDS